MGNTFSAACWCYYCPCNHGHVFSHKPVCSHGLSAKDQIFPDWSFLFKAFIRAQSRQVIRVRGGFIFLVYTKYRVLSRKQIKRVKKWKRPALLCLQRSSALGRVAIVVVALGVGNLPSGVLRAHQEPQAEKVARGARSVGVGRTRVEDLVVLDKLNIAQLQLHCQSLALAKLLDVLHCLKLLLFNLDLREAGHRLKEVRAPETKQAVLVVGDGRGCNVRWLVRSMLVLSVPEPRLLQQLDNIGTQFPETIVNGVRRDNRAQTTFIAFVQTEESDHIGAIDMERLGLARGVDTRGGRIGVVETVGGRAVRKILDVSENVTFAILRLERANVGTNTHENRSLVLALVLVDLETSYHTEAMAVEKGLKLSIDDLLE